MLNIQTVFYENSAAQVERLLACLGRLRVPAGWDVRFSSGDCSAEPVVSRTPTQLSPATEQERASDPHPTLPRQGAGEGFGQISAWNHEFFGENIGFGAGQNRLSEQGPEADAYLCLNPDALFPPTLLESLLDFASKRPNYGLIDVRQIPLEHPKTFDPKTGETEWCSGCCLLADGPTYRAVSGFDPIFFLYCEDVDLSWRVKATGKQLYYCTSTYVFHDKDLGPHGPIASPAEHLNGWLGRLILLNRYGSPGLLGTVERALARSTKPVLQQALSQYQALAGKIRKATTAERSAATITRTAEFNHTRWTYPPTVEGEA